MKVKCFFTKYFLALFLLCLYSISAFVKIRFITQFVKSANALLCNKLLTSNELKR